MTAQDKFWRWFVQHETRLLRFEATQEIEREKIFDNLAEELRKVDRDLVFEFGPRKSKREFVVSAGGIKRAFPAVLSLVQAAPALERWQVVAFRPRRVEISSVDFRGRHIDPKDVEFSLLDDGRIAGIYLFMPGFQENDVALKSIAYLMLDEALGEYDVETRVGLIRMFSSDSGPKEDRHPLAQLPVLFDELVSRLELRSGKPS